MHTDCPSFVLKCPTSQGTGFEVPTLQYVPFGHISGLVVPTPQEYPSGHGPDFWRPKDRNLSSVPAASSAPDSQKNFALQWKVAFVCPVEGQKRPGGQRVHSDSFSRPILSLYVPRGHGMGTARLDVSKLVAEKRHNILISLKSDDK